MASRKKLSREVRKLREQAKRDGNGLGSRVNAAHGLASKGNKCLRNEAAAKAGPAQASKTENLAKTRPTGQTFKADILDFGKKVPVTGLAGKEKKKKGLGYKGPVSLECGQGAASHRQGHLTAQEVAAAETAAETAAPVATKPQTKRQLKKEAAKKAEKERLARYCQSDPDFDNVQNPPSGARLGLVGAADGSGTDEEGSAAVEGGGAADFADQGDSAQEVLLIIDIVGGAGAATDAETDAEAEAEAAADAEAAAEARGRLMKYLLDLNSPKHPVMKTYKK